MDYFSPRHNTEVHRTSTVYDDVSQYPNGHLTKKVVYEEDEIEGSRRHHHHNPEVRERVEVIEYEQVPTYNNRVSEVVYEENVVDVESARYYPRRNKGCILRR
ncbi:hypothetical protein TanjilG_28903 [Lupinus angustifolius]|uniref:Uncharacterized protein n=1 Tax=Lupinus angustifolius TaxID=3871 RepID=A0A4P1QXK0_LUPAN|nr:PREDICTED: uncharacterized protein LOC109327444 [Lupinus angustifolius]OIV97152.1 hypothetical protein TanjilG_28903 [Lupinus angustifolius]